MKQYYIHPFVFGTSKEAGGYNLNTIVKQIIRDCGLNCVTDCPEEDCLPETNVRTVTAPRRAWETNEIEEGFKIVLTQLQAAQAKIDQLEADLAELRKK